MTTKETLAAEDAARDIMDMTVAPVAVICELLRGRIWAGQYDASGRLPDEHELVREFGTSRTRLRAALGVLSAQGLVVRRRGQGTFVSERRLRYQPLESAGFVAAVAQARRSATHHLLSASTSTMDPLSAAEFGTYVGAPVHVIERLTYLDGKPLGTATYLVRADLAPSFLSSELCARNLDTRTWLIEAATEEVASIDVLVEACLADETTAERLGCQPGAALLRLNRHFYTASGEVLAYGSNTHRGDRSAYQSARQFI